ncbi:MAG TPA: GLPGLI family protein [Puia sp.]|jgi:hypothetical protein
MAVMRVFIPKPFRVDHRGLELLKIITIMKRFILLGAWFILLAPGAEAQQPDIAQIVVHYKFSHIRDTTDRAKPYTENMVLLVGKSAGVYKTNEERRSNAEYFQFPREKKMVRKEGILFSRFLITETLPVIDWRITHDTASFGGLHCQKATTHFRGRDYTVWFCPDLPLPVGPWKLNGLPGVIVEGYDTKKEVSFTFDGIEKVNEPKSIKVPNDVSKITDLEFVKLEETAQKDPDAFIRMMSGPQADGRMMKVDMKPGPRPVNNNPIELPEKK